MARQYHLFVKVNPPHPTRFIYISGVDLKKLKVPHKSIFIETSGRFSKMLHIGITSENKTLGNYIKLNITIKNIPVKISK